MPISINVMRVIIVGLLVLGLAACSEKAPEVSEDAQTSITLVEGEASWRHIATQSETLINGSVGANWDDEVSTSPDSSALLQLDDQTTIEMAPDTVISVSRPYPTENRPVIRLLFGSIQVTAQSSNYRFDSYRQLPINFQIVNVNIMLEPLDTPSRFNLRFEDDTAKVDVSAGLIDASAGLVQGELATQWRAELIPTEPLHIIPPWTPTPRVTPTFTATATPTATNTPTNTNTPTRTNTPRPATATFTPTNTDPPTNTAIPNTAAPPPPKPKPTNAPTNPPPPPPTDPPPPPTQRPTPGG